MKLIGEFTDTPSNNYCAGVIPGQAASDATVTMRFQYSHRLAMGLTSDKFSNTGNQQGHYPSGENLYASGTTSNFIFTSYQRDSESGNGLHRPSRIVEAKRLGLSFDDMLSAVAQHWKRLDRCRK